MLPGFFCSTSNLDRPEMLYYKMTPLKMIFPKHWQTNWIHTNILKEVFYSTRKFPLDTDYYYSWKIISTKNELIAYGYGLEFLAFTFIFGAPMYKSKNFIEVELELIKAKQKKLVLKKETINTRETIGLVSL